MWLEEVAVNPSDDDDDDDDVLALTGPEHDANGVIRPVVRAGISNINK